MRSSVFARLSLLLILVITGALFVLTTLCSSTAHAGISRAPVLDSGPDLIVEDIRDAQQPFDCVTPVGLKVVVKNIGSVLAGPSTTHIAASTGEVFLWTPGLTPGEATTLTTTFTSMLMGDTYTATADWSNVVAETDDLNNVTVRWIGLATLPTCTAVPPQTPTATPSPTNTPDPPPVGGIAEVPDGTGSRGGSSVGVTAFFAGIAVAGALVASGWYARRRFARQRR
jgi:CARDB